MRLAPKRSGTRNRTAFCLLLASAPFLLLAACTTPDPLVELIMHPTENQEVIYDEPAAYWRFPYQVSVWDLEVHREVEGYGLNVTFTFAGVDCFGGEGEGGRTFQLEDWNMNPQNCPWQTQTDSNGILKFQLNFLMYETCDFHYVGYVNVFGDTGTSGSRKLDLCCGKGCR